MCHVLIIEDEPLVALHIQSVLAENGATSFGLATTERQAVDAAMAERPAVIVADVLLREGNGLDAVREIQRRAGEIPVIFITATPDLSGLTGSRVRVLAKPTYESSIRRAFIDMAPRGDP